MKVILPGSYDPVTVGHLDIIRRAAEEHDEVFAVVFNNDKKKYRFSVEDRVRMLTLATDGLDNVLVSCSSGLVIDYMREHGIEKIIKGYRDERDLEWEYEQARWNKEHGGYDTELVKCREGFEAVSSTEVRRRLDAGESAEKILPSAVFEYIKNIDKSL
jgi:pantetheine-phosphate adenylyltransferase